MEKLDGKLYPRPLVVLSINDRFVSTDRIFQRFVCHRRVDERKSSMACLPVRALRVGKAYCVIGNRFASTDVDC